MPTVALGTKMNVKKKTGWNTAGARCKEHEQATRYCVSSFHPGTLDTRAHGAACYQSNTESAGTLTRRK